MHKNIYVSIISFFLLIAIFSGMMIYGHFKEANEQEELYNNLAQIVEKNETSPETETPMPTTPPEGGELVMLPEYAELYEQNNDSRSRYFTTLAAALALSPNSRNSS